MIIDKYLWKRLGIATLYVLLAFSALYAIFDLLAESKNIGKEQYTTLTLFKYVLWRIPVYLYDVFPVSVLIGALISLTRLSSNNEYVVMRVCGISKKRLIGILTIFACSCALFNAFIGEYLLPVSYENSNRIKYTAHYGENAAINKNGIWIKSGNDMIHIDYLLPDGTMQGVNRYHLTDDFHLDTITFSQTAQYKDNQWQLNQLNEATIANDKISFRQTISDKWQTNINPDLVKVLIIEPSQMPVYTLNKYIKHLNNNQQRTVTYEIAKWRKIFYPFGAIAMVLVALAFTPVIARHSNMGWRIFLGMCLGVAFHFLGRFFSFYAELFNLTPFISGGMPIILFTLFAIFINTYIQKQQ
ncbi:MAG: LPS export ABC transporter permease LptG [Neisseriaceae bacterium]|nr:LPS export ABC transporter permease LptG [Neisseriaceae bacterium]